jgi:TetR/AcrR family transcriptional regulator, repressor for uid operon
MTVQAKTSARETRRLQTRERIFGAAIAEFQARGTAATDVAAIVAAAGVAHGTFYFHFPTKEHVLLEFESREETRMAEEFARYLDGPHDLAGALAEFVRLSLKLENQVGRRLFREMLALHFSPTHPASEEWSGHAAIVLLVRELERAGERGQLHPGVDAFHSAMFFLVGIYGVLCTADEVQVREAILQSLVATAVRGLENR